MRNTTAALLTLPPKAAADADAAAAVAAAVAAVAEGEIVCTIVK